MSAVVVDGVQLSIAGGGEKSGQKREVTESRTETEAETRQTSTGRPLRECREKVGFNYVLANLGTHKNSRNSRSGNLNSVGPNEHPVLGRDTL